MAKPSDPKREPIVPCTEAPSVRARSADEDFTPPREDAVGYTSRGHVAHFLPDREVNIASLNKALVDVFGEPGMRPIRVELEIDEDYWKQICGDPWSGNIYRYSW